MDLKKIILDRYAERLAVARKAADNQGRPVTEAEMSRIMRAIENEIYHTPEGQELLREYREQFEAAMAYLERQQRWRNEAKLEEFQAARKELLARKD